MSVARNVVFNPMLAPGGGATEMAVSVGLQAKARSVLGVEGWPYRAVADAMEVIPRTLVQNSGGNVIRVLTELRVRPPHVPSFLFLTQYSKAKHANGENSWGVNGETGKIVDMKTYGLYESASVKVSSSGPLEMQVDAAYFRSKLSKLPLRCVCVSFIRFHIRHLLLVRLLVCFCA